MNLGDWVGAAQNAVAAAAIIIGAVWAYYKFLRGRTFSHRAELSILGVLLEGHGRSGIRVRASVKNLGLTKLPLRLKIVRVLAIGEEGWDDSEWRWVKSVPAFEAHDWLEPQEIVTDELLVPLRAGESDALAYVVQLVVIVEQKRAL